MKYIILWFSLLSFSWSLRAQTQPVVQAFPLSDVRLLESPFLHAQELDKNYLLTMEADRLLAPFLREAGLTPKAESYTNWENSGLDGHIGGHYLSALSHMFAATGDPQIGERLHYMISELARCQQANGNGYIGGVPGGNAIWQEIAEGDIRAGGFDLNGKWVPLYNIHKTYAGLRDAWLLTGNQTARDLLIGMADWAEQLVSQLSEEQMQDMLRSEHGGLNETFADVAHITGDDRYLQLAHQFSHRVILDELLRREDKLTGRHANTQIPKVLGFKRIADVEGKSDWSDAAAFFWETVVAQRSVSIGGNSVSEHFNPTDDFSRMMKSIEGPETCNTYNMLRLSKMLFHTSLDKKYVDYYERALYNHILSTQHPHTGGFVYFTQMRPGHYRVYSQPHTSMWCCVGSGIENHARYGEMIYSHTDEELLVNLFIPSRLHWRERGVVIEQTNRFPDEPSTTLTLSLEQPQRFTLNVRCPDWVESERVTVKINGAPQPVEIDKNGYLAIQREWRSSDRVVVEMPITLRAEQLPDKSNYWSFLYGPIVLAAKIGDEEMSGLFADDSRGGHIAHGKQLPMKDMPIVVAEPDELLSHIAPVKEKPLTFRITGLYPEKYADGLELIPFFRLHESRYVIYWTQANEQEVKQLQQRIEKEEAARLALDALTVDRVTCGQQQPESDHFIQADRSNTGFTEDLHWREARHLFSYRLNNRAKAARFLFLSYFDQARPRRFDILMNEIKIATVELAEGDDERLLTQAYALPEELIKEEQIEVKFVAHDNTLTARITEVRLLTPLPPMN
ncbi:glycoside hydrolase family 127 protein [Parabacteroides sp. OttesenSCG-928-N08]|nr:glycoside hydrolase family 127 protein [Parabacteroides sp. OttesenSCG-928-N08]